MAWATHESESGVPPRPTFPVTDPDVAWSVALQQIAAAIPDRIAVDDGTDQVTYADLSGRINRAARAILATAADSHLPVAVLARQGIGAVVGFLAPLHAGMISAPIDLTERRYLEVARGLGADHRRIITIEDTDRFDDTPPVVADGGPTPGFVMFTSGSTGAPKGVLIAHTHLARDMIAQSDTTAFPLDARLPLITSFGFSAAIGQVIYPLLLGATICPFDLPSGSARKLAEWVHAEQITALQILPSLLRALTDLDPPVVMRSVQDGVTVG